MGLDSVLRARRDRLTGILNGVDTTVWNPRTDRHLTHRYSERSLWRKEKVKEALLAEVGLPYAKRVPVLGMVTRLAAQKGIDLLFEPLPELLATRDVRLVVLASGEARYEDFFAGLRRRFPAQVAFRPGYDLPLAHRIEAGSDLFLMPSLYEPCGLNQMYSLAYGTVPVVRRTGGLADTVTLYRRETGEGTGFVFDHFTPSAIRWALEYALAVHADPREWEALMRAGMAQDFSWETAARHYLEVYERALAEA
jgi:starch synthase